MFGGYNNRRWPGVLTGVFASAVAFTVTNWAAANLSALINRGARLHVPARSALVAAVAVIRRWRDPRLAWPPAVQPILPSARTYWLCAAAVVVFAVLACLTVVELRRHARRARARLRRRRAVRAITPRRRHIRTLIIEGPTPNRLLLGRFDHRTLLATEDPSAYVPSQAPTCIGGPVMYLCPDRTCATDAALEAAVNWVGGSR